MNPSFSAAQRAAVVAIAVMASCITTLQPILLGGLLSEDRISAATMGYAATGEALGMAIGTAVSSAFFAPRRLRQIGMAALMVVLAANLITIATHGPWIIAARTLSGSGNGVLLWLLIGMGARSANSTRLFAIYITANAIVIFALSLLISTLAMPAFGPYAGYAVLIGLYALLLPLLRFVPESYAILEGEGKATVPSPRGSLALLAVVLQLAGFMAFWIYCVPLGAKAGIPGDVMRLIVSAAIGVQIVAGMFAITFASRLTGVAVTTITALIGLVAVLSTALSGTTALWALAMFAFAFCWMFGPPFHLAFLSTADPSRRSAMFVGTAQLLGLAIGPLLASAATSYPDVTTARAVSIACFAAATVIAVTIGRIAGGSAAPSATIATR